MVSENAIFAQTQTPKTRRKKAPQATLEPEAQTETETADEKQSNNPGRGAEKAAAKYHSHDDR